jgi:ABC-type multidrug transport system ATPase subunit
MISVSQASKHFKNLTAVEKVDLQVNKGDIMGLLGPDGAGKTTLLRMICGLIPPDEGEILLLANRLSSLTDIGTNWVTCRSASAFMEICRSWKTSIFSAACTF